MTEVEHIFILGNLAKGSRGNLNFEKSSVTKRVNERADKNKDDNTVLDGSGMIVYCIRGSKN